MLDAIEAVCKNLQQKYDQQLMKFKALLRKDRETQTTLGELLRQLEEAESSEG